MAEFSYSNSVNSWFPLDKQIMLDIVASAVYIWFPVNHWLFIKQSKHYQHCMVCLSNILVVFRDCFMCYGRRLLVELKYKLTCSISLFLGERVVIALLRLPACTIASVCTLIRVLKKSPLIVEDSAVEVIREQDLLKWSKSLPWESTSKDGVWCLAANSTKKFLILTCWEILNGKSLLSLNKWPRCASSPLYMLKYSIYWAIKWISEYS